jgi:hypothetical protein
MNNNLYWSVYKNLEREVSELANLIHFDDEQLKVYSIKISELLLRTVVEIESIVKELYFVNGGIKPDDKDLFFDTDCIELLETNWQLSKKKVFVSASNFYFILEDNKILTPLYKANKRSTSSADWQKAYQAVKHNRAKNLAKGNIKHLIRALAALFVLNVYYKKTIFSLDKDATGTNFDNSLGSSIFSIKVHVNRTISADSDYTKNIDFDECIYILKPTDETRTEMQSTLQSLYELTNKRTQENLMEEVIKKLALAGLEITNQEEINAKVNSVSSQIITDIMTQVARENGHLLKNLLMG